MYVVLLAYVVQTSAMRILFAYCRVQPTFCKGCANERDANLVRILPSAANVLQSYSFFAVLYAEQCVFLTIFVDSVMFAGIFCFTERRDLVCR